MSYVFRRPDDYRVKPSPLFLLLAVASAANGTADLSLSATGTLLGSGSMSGTCSIGFTADAVTTGGNLSGQAAGVFGGAGALTATSAAAGVCALTLDAVASPSGSVAYPTAQRQAPKRWTRPEYDFTAYQQRMLIMSLPTETGIFGQCAVIFTPVATLRATGAIAGASAATFGGAGLLRGDGALAGTAALAFTPTATLGDTPTGNVTGSASMTLDGAAAMSAAGRLIGISSSTFLASMTLGSEVPIAGVSAFAFTLTGTMGSALVSIDTPRNRTVLVHDRRRR